MNTINNVRVFADSSGYLSRCASMHFLSFLFTLFLFRLFMKQSEYKDKKKTFRKLCFILCDFPIFMLIMLIKKKKRRPRKEKTASNLMFYNFPYNFNSFIFLLCCLSTLWQRNENVCIYIDSERAWERERRRHIFI